MNVDRLKAKIIKVLKKSNLDVEFDDTTSYDNGAGQTYQFFIEKTNPLFSYIKDNFEQIESDLELADIQVWDYEADGDIDEYFSFEYDDVADE